MGFISHFLSSWFISLTLQWNPRVLISLMTSMHLIQSGYIGFNSFLFLLGAGFQQTKDKLEICSRQFAILKCTHITVFTPQVVEKQIIRNLLSPFISQSGGKHYDCFILMQLVLINVILEKIMSNHVIKSHYRNIHKGDSVFCQNQIHSWQILKC